MTVRDFKEQICALNTNLRSDYSISPENVFQTGNPANREIIGSMMDRLLLPGSRIDNAGAFAELYRRSRNNESCLLLAEHYGNFDFPVLYRLTQCCRELGPAAAASLLPIRGTKLSESTPVTAGFTRSYDTIVIYPSRTLDAISDTARRREIRKTSVPVNHAAMREMITKKHNGRIITVFPAGTRYRPWVPDSRRGVREIHSYIKTFDNVMFLAINGNTLPPNETENMALDSPQRDLMILTCSDLVNGRRFRREEENKAPAGEDPKQYVADRVMEELLALHRRVEPVRLREKRPVCLRSAGYSK